MSWSTLAGRFRRGRRRAFAAGLCASAVLPVAMIVGGPAGVAGATPGALDPAFGSGGAVITASNSGATGVAVGPGGDIAVSSGNPSATSKFAVLVYGSGGAVKWSQSTLNGGANAVAYLPNGNVVAAGYQSTPGSCGGRTPLVAEYTGAGAAVGGAFPVSVGCPAQGGTFNAITADSSGNIVVAGTFLDATATPQTAAAWVNGATGAVTGPITSSTGGLRSEGLAVAVGSNGDAIVAGYTDSTASVAEFTTTGLDSAFGSGGVATLTGQTRAGGVTVIPAGFTAAGTVIVDGTSGAGGSFVAELGTTGTPVRSWGAPGLINSIAYQPWGNVITAAGIAGSGNGEQMLLAQYNASNGAPNSFFASGGTFTTAFSGPSTLFAVAAQPDGKVVAAGGAPSTTPGNTQIGVIRLLGPSLSIDTPATVQVSAAGPVNVTFIVRVDEPLFSAVPANLCAFGASVNGTANCGIGWIPPGWTAIGVTVQVNVTVPPGSDQFQTLFAEPGTGLAPSPTNGAATATIHRFPPTEYRLVASDGGIFNFNAPFYGSTGGQHLNAPIVGMASDPRTGGYWLVASDGGIFSFNAPFFGSMGGQHLNSPIVGMAFDPQTGGYWLVASDGGIFTFGAPYLGSMGGQHLNSPIVGMAADPQTGGYWLVASDGGIFTFGAPFFGSMGGQHLNQPIVGMTGDPQTGGYWLVARDGGIFAFNAPFLGSMGGHPLNGPIVAMTSTPQGDGYWLVASDGGIFTFNAPFFGSMGGHPLNAPIVGMSG